MSAIRSGVVWWGVMAVGGGCAGAGERELADSGGTDPSDDPTACLASLGDVPHTEVAIEGREEVVDGAEVGFWFAPQGDLYTPFVVRMWGQPDLYRWGWDYGGRVMARWSIVDPIDGYVLAGNEHGEIVRCVDEGSEPYLSFAFHALYYGDDGSMRIEEVAGRAVTLSLELGRHPAAGDGETAGGHPTKTDAPVDYTVSLEREIVLVEDASL